MSQAWGWPFLFYLTYKLNKLLEQDFNGWVGLGWVNWLIYFRVWIVGWIYLTRFKKVKYGLDFKIPLANLTCLTQPDPFAIQACNHIYWGPLDFIFLFTKRPLHFHTTLKMPFIFLLKPHLTFFKKIIINFDQINLKKILNLLFLELKDKKTILPLKL